MTPRKVPKGLDWESLPTIEVLMERHGVKKISTARKLVRDVVCYKCSDNTTRYDAASADAAFEGHEMTPMDPAIDDDAPPDGKVTNEYLFSKLIGVIGQQRGATDALIRTMNEVIRTLSGPAEFYIDANTKMWERIEARLDRHEDTYDAMVLTYQELSSVKAQKELGEKREANRLAMQRETMDMMKPHVPALINRFQLTAEAKTVMEFLRGLDPDFLEPFKAAEVLPPEKQKQLGSVIEFLREQKRREQAKAARRRQREAAEAAEKTLEKTDAEQRQAV